MIASLAPLSRPSRRAAAVLSSGIIAFGATGCGGSTDNSTKSSPDSASDNGITQDTAQEILSAAKAAAAKAESATIRGSSQQRGVTLLKIDLQLTKTGGQGTMSLLGLKFEVIRAGEDLYVKGPQSLYTRLGIKKPVPPDTWVKLPSQYGLKAFTELGGESARIIAASGKVTKGATTTIEEQPAIELKTEGKLYKGRLYVKTTGQPYPIKLEKHGSEAAAFTFTDWNNTPGPTAPTNTIGAGG